MEACEMVQFQNFINLKRLCQGELNEKVNLGSDN